jgi:hypothetical protein
MCTQHNCRQIDQKSKFKNGVSLQGPSVSSSMIFLGSDDMSVIAKQGVILKVG